MLLLWALFHFVCCTFPSITAKPNHRAYFVCCPGSYCSHRTLLVIGTVALSSMATILAWGCGLMSSDGAPLRSASSSALIVVSLWSLCGAGIIFQSLEAAFQRRNIAKSMASACISRRHIAVVLLALFRDRAARLIVASRIPTYWRIHEPDKRCFAWSFRSWLLPSAFICGHGAPCRALPSSVPDAPLLPTEASLRFPGPNKNMLDWLRMFSREHGAEPVLKQCKPFAAKAIAVCIVTFIAQWILAMIFGIENQEPIRSLGTRSYAIFICELIAVLVSIMLASACQLLTIWINLAQASRSP